MALISVVQKQLVEKDKKAESELILEGISLASVLPGPVAFNVIAFLGYKLRGIKGALVSMAGIVIPSFLLMILLSVLYLRFGDVPSFTHFFSGILPAVAAVIISVAAGMAKKNIKDKVQVVIAVISAIVILLVKAYTATLAVMVISGIAGYLLYHRENSGKLVGQAAKKNNPAELRSGVFILASVLVVFMMVLILPLLLPENYLQVSQLHRKIMLTFSGMSLSLFGGGYVVIPAMQQVIVQSLGWLSSQQFTDAVAMGQVTPGPIFITATFIGFKVAGFWGAVNATLAIFLPPALLMIVCSRFLETIQNSPAISAIFKGLRPAIIGMIGAAAIQILAGGDLSVKTALLFIVFIILATRYKADPVFLIPGAGLIGLLIF
jgi:chromate transporter